MAKDLNQVSLIGRITKDIELKATSSGKNVISTTIAVNGYQEGDVSFIELVAWDKLADIMAKYLAKGSRVAIGGSLKQQVWEKDGKKNYKLIVQVGDVQFLESQKQSTEQSPKSQVDQLLSESEEVDLSTIPF